MNGGVAADGGKIVINGGNFSLDGTNTYFILVTGSGSIEVNGGTFTRTGANRLLGGFNGMPSWDATGDLAANRYTVTGGTFTVNGETVTIGAKVLRLRNQLYMPADACELFDMRWAYAARNNFISFEHEDESLLITEQP